MNASNIIKLKAPRFSRRVDALVDRLQNGGMFYHIILQDRAHQKRRIPPTLCFGILPPRMPSTDALQAAEEIRDIWLNDADVRRKMIDWDRERGLVLHKESTPNPSTSRQ